MILINLIFFLISVILDIKMYIPKKKKTTWKVLINCFFFCQLQCIVWMKLFSVYSEVLKSA